MKTTYNVRVLSCAIAALLAAGCASSKKKEFEEAFVSGTAISPMPPPFLNGPMSLLVTNPAGYSAVVSMESHTTAGKPETLSGDLLCLGGKLLFSPVYERKEDKAFRAADVSFIWDVTGNGGYILSEALQGYAPLTTTGLYTNVIVSSAAAPTAEGKLVSVAAADGGVTDFRVVRSQDATGAPLRIVTPPAAPATTVTFSKIRAEPPPAALFQPPDGFTRYPNAEAMMGELAMRRHNLKKR
jgi:hypothetical protein